MKFKKLIEKAETLFSPSKRDKAVKKKCLKKLIRKLKEDEKKSREKLEKAEDKDTRDSLEKRILVAKAQRKKGLMLLKESAE